MEDKNNFECFIQQCDNCKHFVDDECQEEVGCQTCYLELWEER